MQSLKSRLLFSLIRHRHLLSGQLRPDVITADFDVHAFRASVDRMTAKNRLPANVRVEPHVLGGLRAERLIPADAPEGKTLLYLHGGGFLSGSCDTHRAHVAKFAAGAGVTSTLFDYRLAPEHPFPAGLDDCVAAYRTLLSDGIAPADIVVGGESAGGTLTLCLLLALKAQHVPLPAAAFAISPVTDMRCRTASFRTNEAKDIVPRGANTHWLPLYYGQADPTDPLISPLFGDLSNLPPLLILAGGNEIHLDDCIAFAEQAEAAGVDVTLSLWSGMVHAFPLLAPLIREARDALADLCGFTRFHLGLQNGT